MGEAVGEVTDGPALLVQLRLKVGPLGTGLDAREAGVGIDVDDPAQASEVERDDRAALAGDRLEAAGDVAAAAERDDDGVGRDRGIHDGLHLGLVRRVDDNVGAAEDRVAADADQVAQALAVGVHDAGHVVGGDVVGTDDGGQRVGELGRGVARGNVQIVERGLTGTRGGLEVEADRKFHERREPRLVFVVEAHTVDTPAPPLHVAHRTAVYGLVHLDPF